MGIMYVCVCPRVVDTLSSYQGPFRWKNVFENGKQVRWQDSQDLGSPSILIFFWKSP